MVRVALTWGLLPHPPAPTLRGVTYSVTWGPRVALRKRGLPASALSWSTIAEKKVTRYTCVS